MRAGLPRFDGAVLPATRCGRVAIAGSVGIACCRWQAESAGSRVSPRTDWRQRGTAIGGLASVLLVAVRLYLTELKRAARAWLSTSRTTPPRPEHETASRWTPRGSAITPTGRALTATGVTVILQQTRPEDRGRADGLGAAADPSPPRRRRRRPRCLQHLGEQVHEERVP
jgi:hypothetical protein